MIVFIIVVIAFVLLLIFMAMPTFRRHPDRKLLEGLKIAHRGLHNGCNNGTGNSGSGTEADSQRR